MYQENEFSLRMRLDKKWAKAELLALFKRLHTFSAVAAELGCSTRSLHRWVADLGVDFPKDPGGKPRHLAKRA